MGVVDGSRWRTGWGTVDWVGCMDQVDRVDSVRDTVGTDRAFSAAEWGAQYTRALPWPVGKLAPSALLEKGKLALSGLLESRIEDGGHSSGNGPIVAVCLQQGRTYPR